MSANEEMPADNDQPTLNPPSTPEEAAAAAASDEDKTPPLDTRLETLLAEKAELKDRMLRIAADFDNYKKRARKEQSDGEARTKEAVLRDFLEIIDNLERATASWGQGKSDGKPDAKANDVQSIKDGVELVLRQFRLKLDRYQVKSVDAQGLPFDPRMHEAISQVPTADAKPGSVLHELQKGYVIGDKLLRPALVVVAAAPPAASAAGDVSAQEAPAKGEDKAS